MPKPDLENAYALKSDDDIRQLYANWADTYESSFAADMDFVLPRIVAEHFAQSGGAGPVLDFGCGTGLVGEILTKLGVDPVDGIDLSAEMLDVAARKDVYRELIAGNILDGLTLSANGYQGIVSSGTFTHGHVGPDAIDALLRLAAPGGLLALSINAAHFQTMGFAAKLEALDQEITELRLPEVRFYGPDATGEHKDDTGFIAMFRKA